MLKNPLDTEGQEKRQQLWRCESYSRAVVGCWIMSRCETGMEQTWTVSKESKEEREKRATKSINNCSLSCFLHGSTRHWHDARKETHNSTSHSINTHTLHDTIRGVMDSGTNSVESLFNINNTTANGHLFSWDWGFFLPFSVTCEFYNQKGEVWCSSCAVCVGNGSSRKNN